MRPILMPLILALALGCGDSKAENVPLDQVPEPVMQVAKGKLPDVHFEQAWKTTKGNYEVRGKTKHGKVRDIQLTPSGEVIEID
jgi:hypothetical protein